MQDLPGGPSSRPLLASSMEAKRMQAFPATHPLVQDVYLDSASAPPVPTALYDAAHEYLTRGEGVGLTSTHSQSPSGLHTLRQLDRARRRVCKDLFGVKWTHEDDGWDVAFSSGTTASLQLAARSFAFGTHGSFAYTRQAHSSLVGLRDIVAHERKDAPARVESLDVDDLDSLLRYVDATAPAADGNQHHTPPRHLLCLPLQCNATGKRYTDVLSRVLKRRQEHEVRTTRSRRSLFILVDAAAYLSSSRLDLGKFSTRAAPDFVAFSMYKILGTPTGLGGLLMQRTSAFDALLPGKQYFGGGALDLLTASSPGIRIPASSSLHEAFEDGTVNTQAIASLPAVMDACDGGWRQAEEYVSWLQTLLHSRLSRLTHHDGSPVCRLYSSPAHSSASQGPTILFNVLLPTSQDVLDPIEVARLAAIEGIHLRSGRMCNVGAVSEALGVDDDEILRQWTMGVGCRGAGVQADEASSLPATSALRLSLCVWNTEHDVDRFVAFIRTFFQRDAGDAGDEFFECHSDAGSDHSDSTSSTTTTTPPSSYCDDDTTTRNTPSHRIASIHLYPIKSCASQDVPMGSTWPLTPTGLLYDRHFGIVDVESGKVLSQKRHPKMARIRPQIQRSHDRDTLRVCIGDDATSLELSVRPDAPEWQSPSSSSSSFDLCGSQIEPILCADERVRTALTAFLGVPCTLARLPVSCPRTGLGGDATPILFSNESPFLMINRRSVLQVCRWIKERGDDGDGDGDGDDIDEARVAAAFRANFVIDDGGDEINITDYCAPDGMVSFEEDAVHRINIGDSDGHTITTFAVLGPCRRCEMVGLDQVTGEARPQILRAVAANRRCRAGRYAGRILFGLHLEMLGGGGEDSVVRCGSRVSLRREAEE